MFVRIFEGQHFPAKAISLVVEACTNVRIQQDSRPMDIDDLHKYSISNEIDEIRRLKRTRENQLIALKNSESNRRKADLLCGAMQKNDKDIALLEEEVVAETLVLTKIVGPDQITEVHCRLHLLLTYIILLFH
ncbi:Chaperone protein ClpB1 [Apostasia shenzhenica]|uniref:Chaperone protein ClpB1 n=1 Tax=Apostasia shenzhenica TaxID=1088818 RepID=A0A2I0A3E7_9ASPA|nr:Chaperone protein ClpB1 [Apostasia shenzhenica]